MEDDKLLLSTFRQMWLIGLEQLGEEESVSFIRVAFLGFLPTDLLPRDPSPGVITNHSTASK
jgi:hypothetical protein